jgi:hypothetical protein
MNIAATLPGCAVCGSRGYQSSHRCLRVSGGYERLPHQDSPEAGSVKRFGIIWALDAGLGHAHHTFRNHRCHSARAVRINIEGGQVTLVDTHKHRTDVQNAFQFGLVVNLDEGVHAEFGGEGMKVGQFSVVEGSRNEQNSVGTHQPGVTYIAQVDREVLA